MKKNAISFLVTVFVLFLTSSLLAETALRVDDNQPLKSVLLMRNLAGEKFNDLGTLTGLLTAKLSSHGFSLVDPKMVWETFDDGSRFAAKEQISASALQIGKKLKVDYIIIASVESLDITNREFQGKETEYKTNTRATIYSAIVTLTVIEADEGRSVYADTVLVSEKVVAGPNIAVESTIIPTSLWELAATKIANNIADQVKKIRIAHPIKPQTAVDFSLDCNIAGATVELDGVVIGTTPGSFQATPGIHFMKISQQLMNTWEHHVNISPGQKFNVVLELSPEGVQRYQTMENFKRSMEREKAIIDRLKLEKNSHTTDAETTTKTGEPLNNQDVEKPLVNDNTSNQ
ncbi:MAG: PEGA domain-containing protein [Deltaproteobacteria bacterium]|nr:PEGA domain-containing protein [Deltaproteobacteria bacterium]